VSILEKKKTTEQELQPLSKEEALKSINQFREDFQLTNISANRNQIVSILKKSGLISDAITESRRD
jgi:hypothetical protein